MLGTTLNNKYLITGLLGQGGMGAVYEAQHTGTGRRVAVKVISTGDITKDQALVGRFHREAKAAGSIDTQHIVQVLDTGTDENTGLPFMAMEFLAGEDAQELFNRVGPVPPDVAVRMVAQACLGLQKAHDSGVVHRDIKPANLFLAERDEGEVLLKILDFGVAKIKVDQMAAAESQGLTRTGSMIGSPLYMSPEQARGAKNIDHRADLWSLGVVMYQALTGRTPHHHIEALGELIIAICSEEPTPVQDFAPWVPPEVAAIVHGALRFDPAERFASAADMLAAMKPLLPYGWALRKEMLRGLTDEERAGMAARLPVAPMGSRMTSMPAPGLSMTPAGTHDPLVQSRGSTAAPTQPASSKALLAVGGAALLGLGGLGVYFATGAGAAQQPIVVVQPAQPPTVDTSQPAAAAVAPVKVPDPVRTVKLVVLPEDSAVEIDGEPTITNSGIVDIVGPLGSVHRVRLMKSGAETTEEVVVTTNGALPAKIELSLPSRAGIVRARPAGPTASSASTATPAAKPSSAPRAPGLKTDFE